MDHLGLNLINKLLNDESTLNRYVTKHFLVTWNIGIILDTNYAPTFRSSDINLGEEIGTCHLMVTLNFTEDFIVVELIFDTIENYYSLNYRFGFKNKNGVYWHPDKICNFTGKTSLSRTCETISDYFNDETKTFEVLCQIMITTCIAIPRKDELHARDRLEIAISMDFYNLFKSEFLSDITLRVEGKDIKAHKAILTAKSEVFRKLINEIDCSENTLTLSDTDYDVVHSMIIFMYTGNFEIWETFYRPTIALFSCVDKYNITDLRKFLFPVGVNFADVCFVKMSDFMWNFNKSREFNTIVPSPKISPLFQTQFGSFYMKLFIENSSDNYLKITVEPCNILQDMFMNIRMQICDSEKNVFFSKCLKCFFEKGSKKEITFSTVKKIDLLHSFTRCLIGNSEILYTGGQVAVSNYEICHRISSQKDYSSVDDKYADFQCLLDKSIYSDFKFVAGEYVFLVHKAILGGRSPHFKDLFDKFPELEFLKITDLKPSALERFLSYVYSGNMGEDIETHMDLVLAFDKYLVTTLGTHLLLVLPVEINVETVCVILLTLNDLRNTDYFEDMKSAAVSLLCSNFIDIEPSQNWENLIKQNSKLAREILLYMQDVYQLA